MSKIDIADSISMFRCPVCNREMKVFEAKRIACRDRHSFDLSGKGYVNLLLNAAQADYDKKMLESRNILCRNDFFRPMIDEISALILKEALNKSKARHNILDAGCGEGSHIYQVISKLSIDAPITVKGYGIDISKEGIKLAARNYPGIMWCVADLARIPFAGRQFDVILSILSPSNYAQFNRVLADNGIIIKILPGSSYLKELRSHFYGCTDKETYSKNRVIEHFKNSFDILDTRQIQYTMPVSSESLEQLVRMTPLSWRAPVEKLKDIHSAGIENVSVDLTVVVGAKQGL